MGRCALLGLGSFSIDNEEDLAKGRDIIGEQTVLVGNVPPVDVVYLGNRETIHAGSERSSGKRDEFEVWLYFKHWLSDSYEYSDRKHRIFHGSGGYLWKI